MTSADLARRIEDNVEAFLLQMGAAGGGEERRDAEVTWTVGGSPIGYHNAVVRCDARDGGAVVADWRAALARHGVPGSWHLTPAMRPADLPALLVAAGFEDGGEEPAMAADLSELVDTPATDLTIEVVADRVGLTDYEGVLAVGFGEGPSEARWAADVFARIGFGAGWRHLVGRDTAGRAVATASLLVTPPVGGIYFVCTVPGARRRGYGSAITHRAMAIAADDGATHAVLGSSPMGQGVYERLGFETVFTYRLFETAT